MWGFCTIIHRLTLPLTTVLLSHYGSKYNKFIDTSPRTLRLFILSVYPRYEEQPDAMALQEVARGRLVPKAQPL
jgi:hypothetical protein